MLLIGTGLFVSTTPAAIAQPGGTTITLGGTAKIDGIYSTNSRDRASDPADYALIPGQLSVLDGGDALVFTVRSSLLFIKSRTSTRYGSVDTYFEVSPVAADPPLGAEHTLRITEAYGRIGPVLAGRTWSNWMDVETVPEINDLGSPAGMIVARSPQVRYTLALPPLDGRLQLSAEAMDAVFMGPHGASIQAADELIPDFVAKLVVTGPWGQVSMAGLVRGLRSAGALPAMPTVTDTALAYGGRIAGKFMFGDRSNLRFEASMGRGTGGYVAFGAYADAELAPNGTLQPVEVAAALLAAQLWLSDTIRINVAGSLSRAFDHSRTLAYHANGQLASVHANVMWNLVEPVRVGIEYIAARRELESGHAGTLHRVQGALSYSF